MPGKRDALRKGWNAASTDLVALVDSDTIWAPDVAAEVCKPFADPRIGGVGTRQSVYGSKGLLARLTDMFLDHRYFDENASQSLLGKAVSCLSGRTAIYRRSVLMDIEQDFMHETFWGVPCLSGDDKRLTTLTLERGHLTYMQRTAQVWSTFPDSPRVFRKQRLRWARNTWRSDLRALSNRWVWSHPFLAYTMIDKAVSGFTVLLGPDLHGVGDRASELDLRRRAGDVVADQPLGQAAAAPLSPTLVVLLHPGIPRLLVGDGDHQDPCSVDDPEAALADPAGGRRKRCRRADCRRRGRRWC